MKSKSIYARKVFSLLSVVAILMSFLCIATSAETVTEDVLELPEGIYYFEDGSYVVTESFDLSGPETRAATGTESYGKRSTYYDGNDVAQCALEVIGKFTVNYGSSVGCASVTAKTYVYKDGWTVEKVTKSSSSGFGATASATASGEFVYKVLFVTVKRIPVSVTVTCDKNGNGN